ncbi:type II toxin-antitoxin system VapC family toxin [Ensifer sp. HO-A22]|uniref:Ribonuclease VapC n=1 Tax=Ensifer oleiphilus TaxID=2742698 RepID=A0A7Y6QBZ9_9HYPH|nr:type II toxin-antitoxin system VapC family toxin [Ensifer oleiphilus]NVD42863.1 type II toxin-antitoxin system VapC family toxin [Ensifer oleiphilus]
MSKFILDASIAAAWLLPEEYSEAAEQLIAGISGPCPVPDLFWHETRSILISAERRQRIAAGQAHNAMARLRRLPLEDMGAGQDGSVLELASAHGLSAYDAAYLDLAVRQSLPLATLDRKLAGAARTERIQVLGPFENEH